MAATSLQRSAYGQGRSPRSRAASAALAVGLVLVLLWLLLHLGYVPQFPPPGGGGLKTFNVGPEAQKAAVANKSTHQVAAKPAAAAARKVVPPPLPVTKAPSNPASPLLAMTLGDSDIGKLAHAPKGGDDAGDGKDSAAPYGPGAGPGGAKLYNAEWYREPGPGVLALYLHTNPPPGAWAEIECQTIPDYHVENCRQLQESRPGLGLSRAMREAAWQFLVRPPRVGGKSLVGAWVRIHYEIVQGKKEEREGAGPADDGTE